MRYEGRPTASQLRRLETLLQDLESVEEELTAYLGEELGPLNALLTQADRKPLAVPE